MLHVLFRFLCATETKGRLHFLWATSTSAAAGESCLHGQCALIPSPVRYYVCKKHTHTNTHTQCDIINYLNFVTKFSKSMVILTGCLAHPCTYNLATWNAPKYSKYNILLQYLDSLFVCLFVCLCNKIALLQGSP